MNSNGAHLDVCHIDLQLATVLTVDYKLDHNLLATVATGRTHCNLKKKIVCCQSFIDGLLNLNCAQFFNVHRLLLHIVETS